MAQGKAKVSGQPDHISIKFVKKAGQWLTTTVKDGKFTQVWSSVKPQ